MAPIVSDPPSCHVSRVAPGLSTCYPSRSPGNGENTTYIDPAEFPEADPIYIYTHIYIYKYIYIHVCIYRIIDI